MEMKTPEETPPAAPQRLTHTLVALARRRSARSLKPNFWLEELI